MHILKWDILKSTKNDLALTHPVYRANSRHPKDNLFRICHDTNDTRLNY